MMRLTIAIALAWTWGYSVAAGQAPKWTAAEFSIAKKAPNGFQDDIISPQHTTLTARLQIPDGFLVGADLKKSKLVTFCDDKSTDLLKGDKKMPFGTGSDPTSPDGQKLVIVFQSSELPAPGTKKLRVKGEIAVNVATDEKVIEVKNASLAKGVDLQFGTLQLTNPRKFSLAKTPIDRRYVSYQGNRPLKSLILLDEAGKETPFSSTFRGINPNAKGDGPYTTTFHFGMKSSMDRCTIRATYYEKVEQRMVPIDLEVGFGF